MSDITELRARFTVLSANGTNMVEPNVLLDTDAMLAELARLEGELTTIAVERNGLYSAVKRLEAGRDNLRDTLQMATEETYNLLSEATERGSTYRRRALALRKQAAKERDEQYELQMKLDAAEQNYRLERLAMDSVVYAAHMPADYQFGLPSWINQRLYASYIGLHFSDEVMEQIKTGRLSFPESRDARERDALRLSLAASQAREGKLRAALEWFKTWHEDTCSKAKGIQNDCDCYRVEVFKVLYALPAPTGDELGQAVRDAINEIEAHSKRGYLMCADKTGLRRVALRLASLIGGGKGEVE